MNATARVVAAADHLAALIEAAARGLKRRKHKVHLDKARARVRKLISAGFEKQGAAFLAAVRPHIRTGLAAYPPLQEASSTGKRFAQTIMPASVSPLSFPVTHEDDVEYRAAIADAITAAAGVVASEIGASAAQARAAAEDMAGRYLRDNSLGKLTGGFSDTSIERLQNAIGNAWDKGGSYEQVVSAIQDTFADFSDKRAGLVAQTEVVDAYNYGRNQTARALGMQRKRWETESGNPCEICLANEAQGWIGIDEDFDSGDAAPTAHPRCECVLAFSDEADEED